MLDTVLDSFVSLLQAKGLNAVRQFREELLDRDSDVLFCVGLKCASILNSGAGEYLGLCTDERTGAQYELYGFRADLNIALDIFSKTAALCSKALDSLGSAISSLPSGVKGAELVCGEIQPDSGTELYLLPVELKCRTYLSAEMDEETGEFTDFILRGVLR